MKIFRNQASAGRMILLILLVGGFASIQVYDALQYGTVTELKTLNDVQKRILDSSESLSNWLLGMTYSCLVGLTLMLIRRDVPVRRESILPFIAGAFLILSLLGRFLFFDAMFFALSAAGFPFFTGALGRFPIILQFYCLILGIVFLGIWLYPRMTEKDDSGSGKVIAPLLLVLLIGTGSPGKAQSCVTRWQEERRIDLGPARSDAEHLLDAVRRKGKAAPFKPQDCEFEFAALDQIRAAQTLNEVPGSITLGKYISNLNNQVTSTGFSTSDLAAALVDTLEIWRSSKATLNILSPQKREYTVFVDGDEKGVTDCKLFVKPGKHNVRAALDGKPVFKKDIELQSSETRKVEITSP